MTPRVKSRANFALSKSSAPPPVEFRLVAEEQQSGLTLLGPQAGLWVAAEVRSANPEMLDFQGNSERHRPGWPHTRKNQKFFGGSPICLRLPFHRRVPLFPEILAQGISPIQFLPALPVRQPWQGGLFLWYPSAGPESRGSPVLSMSDASGANRRHFLRACTVTRCEWPGTRPGSPAEFPSPPPGQPPAATNSPGHHAAASRRQSQRAGSTR